MKDLSLRFQSQLPPTSQKKVPTTTMVATLLPIPPPPFTTLTSQKHPTKTNQLSSINHHQQSLFNPILNRRHPHKKTTTLRAHKVTIEHQGKSTQLEVDPDETILSKALDSGLIDDLPHDCKLGVCMTCPAKLIEGSVDQSEGMLSDDVVESGYALLCVAYPKSDCVVRTIDEEELLSLQLATAND